MKSNCLSHKNAVAARRGIHSHSTENYLKCNICRGIINSIFFDENTIGYLSKNELDFIQNQVRTNMKNAIKKLKSQKNMFFNKRDIKKLIFAAKYGSVPLAMQLLVKFLDKADEKVHKS